MAGCFVTITLISTCSPSPKSIALSWPALAEHGSWGLPSGHSEHWRTVTLVVSQSVQKFCRVVQPCWRMVVELAGLRIASSARKQALNEPVQSWTVEFWAQSVQLMYWPWEEDIGQQKPHGVCHAEELQFLFPIAKDLFVTAVPTPEELEVRRAITKLWVDFAGTGHPTPAGSNGGKVPQWPPTDRFPLTYLRIGSLNPDREPLFAVEQGFMEERAEFWRKLKAHHPAGSMVNEVAKDEL
ncbi:juvenile hormone esterase [Culex quinquefasciatus]|uniref:Juvenile hormone esterase n=1 Tax=Culex quinquefasciatus TaxID=7176 RepID=B0XHP3_CULQU|nr:juvenile hormone esterase [Culex quinquefasciatus]|eukprot:XP_001869165.1 juvenile hormone esterase [Culex quinquefasciatus]